MDQQHNAVPRELFIEVLKRDKFECVFCQLAPYTKPLTIMATTRVYFNRYSLNNLVSTCRRCLKDGVWKENYKDGHEIREVHLPDMPNKREQFRLMLEWQKGRTGTNVSWEELCAYWKEIAGGYKLHNSEVEELRNMMRGLTFYNIKDAMDLVYIQFLRKHGGSISENDMRTAFSKVRRVADIIADPTPVATLC